MTYSDRWPDPNDHLSDEDIEVLLDENLGNPHLASCWECTQRAMQMCEFDRVLRTALEEMTFGSAASDRIQ